MNSFWLLLFAHLLGDYAFQTNSIAQNKTKNLVGLLKHIYLIFVANIIVVMPKTFQTWFGIIVITLIHFLEDSQPFSKKKGNVWIFLLDQAIHITTIFIVSYFIVFTNPFISPKMAFIISAFLFVVYFLDFVEFFILKRSIYDRDIIKVSYGALILTFAFYYVYVIPAIIIAVFLIDRKKFHRDWIYITLVTVISCIIVSAYKIFF